MLAHVAAFITNTISSLGYAGIAGLMAIESACIPLPSEVIMPFSGYLASTGRFSLWLVALAGAVGSVAGSMVAYGLGAWGGRPLVERYGRYVLVSRDDLDRADRWFARYGDITILIGRVLPVVRTFIGFPGGMARMNLWRFNLYTFIGSFVWSLGLAWIGRLLGEHWDTLGGWFHRFDVVIVALVVVGAALYLIRHLRSA
ncbi:MAG TPA: DedA family protein [Trueperaceae bacterium]|nr:DedA family protein [Trueperaceae bacterium]